MSILASRVPRPLMAIRLATSSTHRYSKEQSSLSMPSLTLCPCGLERSTMRRAGLTWGSRLLGLSVTPSGPGLEESGQVLYLAVSLPPGTASLLVR